MKQYPPLTVINARLDYDPITGIFTRKSNAHGFNKKYVGKRAGSIRGKPGKAYRSITVGGVRCYEHRLAFLIMTGRMPTKIDHDDGDGLNNKWANLREATNSQNGYNKGMMPYNNTGYKGVSRIARKANPYRSSIRFNGKRYDLGVYPTAEAAYAAYSEAAIALHGEFARVS